MNVSASSSSDLKLDYMNLLVTQMKNQNPMEPMDNADMTSQLAQLSSLEQMENLNQSFQQVLDSTEESYANSLLGKNVTFVDENAYNEQGIPGVQRTGIAYEIDVMGDTKNVKIMEYDDQGEPQGQYSVEMDKVTKIGI